MKHNQDKSLNMNRYAHKKTKAERCDVLFIQTIDTRQLSAWIKDLRDDMIFSARMRNMGQLIRWMEFLSQTNRLSNWGGAKHSHAFWESSRTWEWLRFQSELCRIVRNTRTRERFFDQMSGIARLTKSNCPRQTDACMKGPRASNKSSKNARECFAPPSHLRLESERHKLEKCFSNAVVEKIVPGQLLERWRVYRVRKSFSRPLLASVGPSRSGFGCCRVSGPR